MNWKKAVLPAVLGVLAVNLAGCDNGPSAVHKESGSAQAPGRAGDASGPAGEGPRVDHRRDAVVKSDDGKPVWAASRAKSAEDAAQRAFEGNGEAFGASTLTQYIQKAHAFVDHPPKGTQTLVRKNGDTLFYDPKSNVFAVANKAGAPRTMFKPDDGQAYWEKQKSAAERQSARGSRRSGDDAA